MSTSAIDVPPPTRSPGRRRGVTVMAAAVALVTAAVLAVAGAAIGWRGAPELPSETEVSALAAAAFPGARPLSSERVADVFDYAHPGSPARWFPRWFLGDDDYQTGYQLVAVSVTDRSPAQVLATARSVLVGQGWTVAGGDSLRAVRGGAFAEVYRSDAEGGRTPGQAVTLSVERRQPAPAIGLALAGWVIGLGVGFVVARRIGRRARAGFAPVAGAFLVLLLPVTLITTVGVLADVPALWTPAYPAPLWGAFMVWVLRSVTLIGLAGLILVGAAAATWSA